MNKFILDKEISRLIVLQRIELLNPFQKKIRKFFGRYIFTNFYLKFLINKNSISSQYYDLMQKEYETLKKDIGFSNKKYLSIGGGLGGFELIINKDNKNNFFILLKKIMFRKKLNMVGMKKIKRLTMIFYC